MDEGAQQVAREHELKHGENGYVTWAEALPHMAAGRYIYRAFSMAPDTPHISVDAGHGLRVDLHPSDGAALMKSGALARIGGCTERRESWWVLRTGS